MSKISRLIRGIYHWIKICERYWIVSPDIEVHCNRLEVIQIVLAGEDDLSLDLTYFDLISTLFIIIDRYLGRISFDHVEGHQNDKRYILELDIWDKMNIVVDIKAKVALWESLTQERSDAEYILHPDCIPAVLIAYQGFNFSILSKLKLP